MVYSHQLRPCTIRRSTNKGRPEDPATVSGAKGAHVLDDILTGRVKALRDDTDFADDHLFCEWCYWIDFENRTLRVQSNSRFKPAIIDETRPFAELGTRFLVWLDWLGTEWESDRGEADEMKRKRAEAMGMTDEERDKLLDGLVVEYGKKRGLPTF